MGGEHEFEELEHFEGELLVVGLYGFLLFPDELEQFDQERVQLDVDGVHDVLVQVRLMVQLAEVAEHQVFAFDDLVVDVHHSAAGHCGWRGHHKIRHFKQDLHFVVQFDPLAVRETEHHGIVQDRIHVFDP